MAISFIPDNASAVDAEGEAKNLFPNVYEQLEGEDRYIVNIAKKIRADIRLAIKKGLIPEGKYGVVKRHHNAIDIEVRGLTIKVFNKEYLENQNGDTRFISRYNDEAANALAVLRVIIDRYNYDRSDIMTDYFDVNYYSNVQVEFDVEDRERQAFEAGTWDELEGLVVPKKKAQAAREAFKAANPPKVEAEGEVASVTHNPRKNGIEIRFSDPAVRESQLNWLGDNGYRYSKRQDMYYRRFDPAALADAKDRFGGTVDQIDNPDSIQVGSGF